MKLGQNTSQDPLSATSSCLEAARKVQYGDQCCFPQCKYVYSSASAHASGLPLIQLSATSPTGSPSGPPPPVSNDLNAAVQDAAKKDPMGQSAPGKDKAGNNDGQTVMGEAGKEKTAKERMFPNKCSARVSSDRWLHSRERAPEGRKACQIPGQASQIKADPASRC